MDAKARTPVTEVKHLWRMLAWTPERTVRSLLADIETRAWRKHLCDFPEYIDCVDEGTRAAYIAAGKPHPLWPWNMLGLAMSHTHNDRQRQRWKAGVKITGRCRNFCFSPKLRHSCAAELAFCLLEIYATPGYKAHRGAQMAHQKIYGSAKEKQRR